MLESRPNIQGKQETNPARLKLKNLAWLYIDTLTENQAKIILRDIRILEQFLVLDDKNIEKETHGGLHPSVYRSAYNRTKADRVRSKRKNKEVVAKSYYRDGLKSVIGGMINRASLARVSKILNDPGKFTRILSEGSLVEEFTSLEEIEIAARSIWPDLLWGIETVREDFERAGLNVKVEFFRPTDPKFGSDYIIVSNGKQGIIVPRYGMKVEFPGPFKKPEQEAGVEVPSSLILIKSFPEVVLDYEHRYGEDRIHNWKIKTMGEIGMPVST